jgi:hypothetical protein
MVTPEGLDACAKLQLKIESGEHALFPVRQELLELRKSLEISKLNFITSGKSDEAKKIVLELKARVFHLQGIKDRCEEIIRCTDNCVELIEMAYPGVANEARERYEELVLQANAPMEGIIEEIIAAPGVCEVLAHDGETPTGYKYSNSLANPKLEELWTVPKTEGST